MGVGKNVDMEIHNSSLFPLYCCYVIIDADTESLVVLRHRKLIPLTQDFLLSAVLSFLSVHGCCIKTYLSDTLIESVASLIEYVWEASDVQFTPRCKLSLCLIIFEAVWVILSRSLGWIILKGVSDILFASCMLNGLDETFHTRFSI